MKHAYLPAVLLAACVSGAYAVELNTDALKKIQDEGLKALEEAHAEDWRSFKLPSGQCLQIAGDPAKVGANLVVRECKPDAQNQQWQFDAQGRLVSQGNTCIGVAGDPQKPSGNAVMQQCGAPNAQRWALDDKQRLVNKLGRCLHAAGPPGQPSGNVIARGCADTQNQVWGE